MFLFPFPCILQKLISRKILFFNALLLKHIHHFCFCGNGSMIGSRHPASFITFHPGFSDKHVLNSIVKHVPHVQNPCHICDPDIPCRISHANPVLTGFQTMPIMHATDFESVETRSQYWDFFLFQIPITTIIVLIVLLKRPTATLMCRLPVRHPNHVDATCASKSGWASP